MKTVKVFTLLILLILSAGAFGQDTRDQPIDCIILLDKSHSMEPKIAKAKAYLEKEIMPLLVFGDTLKIMTFYGKVEALFERTIRSKEDLTAASAAISSVKADGDWTDIGNVLDSLKKILEGMGKDGKKKFILLVTDEKQEPPKGSIYPTQASVESHIYLSYVKRTVIGDFKSIVIGVGLEEKIEEGLPYALQALDSIPSARGDLPETESAAKEYEAQKAIDAAAAAGGGQGGFPLLPVAGGAALLALAVVAILIARGRSRKKDEEKGKKRIDAE